MSVASDGAGRGALVTLRWPLAAIQAAPPEALRPCADESALHGLRVLVVEDMDDSREALRVMLERFGANVQFASDGIEALRAAAGDEVDLILCDLRMPRMDGFEFFHELNGLEGHRHPPVIAVSGLASSADHVATRVAGFIGHIDKPFDDGRLLAEVRVAMAVQTNNRRKADRPR